jgi:hypothetical protein
MAFEHHRFYRFYFWSPRKTHLGCLRVPTFRIRLSRWTKALSCSICPAPMASIDVNSSRHFVGAICAHISALISLISRSVRRAANAGGHPSYRGNANEIRTCVIRSEAIQRYHGDHRPAEGMPPCAHIFHCERSYLRISRKRRTRKILGPSSCAFQDQIIILDESPKLAHRRKPRQTK